MKFILISLTFGTVLSQSWSHRLYFKDMNCTSQFTYGVQQWLPTDKCPQALPANANCETKSVNPVASSSEASMCGIEPPSDSPYFPPASQVAVVAGSKYLVINRYSGSDCAMTPTVTLEQETFVADGKCYAIETTNSFFKATCDGTSGFMLPCSDDQCTKCDDNHRVDFNPSCVSGNQQPTRMMCIDPASLAKPSNATVSSNATANAAKPSQTPSQSTAYSRYSLDLLPLAFFLFVSFSFDSLVQ